MSDSKADSIKRIRSKTGAAVMMIKKALIEAGGEETKALEILTSLGHSAAQKKESRATASGCVDAYVHTGSQVGVLIELRSETDFVSRNAQFQELAHNIAMHIAAMDSPNTETLLAEPYIKNPQETIGDLVKNASAVFGEHIAIARFARFEL